MYKYLMQQSNPIQKISKVRMLQNALRCSLRKLAVDVEIVRARTSFAFPDIETPPRYSKT